MTDTVTLPRKRIIRLSRNTEVSQREYATAQFPLKDYIVGDSAHALGAELLRADLLEITERDVPERASRTISIAATVIVPGSETKALRNEVRDAVKAERKRIIMILGGLADDYRNETGALDDSRAAILLKAADHIADRGRADGS